MLSVEDNELLCRVGPGTEWYRIRSGSTLLPKDVDWFQATERLRTASVEHPELDWALTGGA
jgi:hypothetical protein